MTREQHQTVSNRETRGGSERDWHAASARPDPVLTRPGRVTRTDLFRELDWLATTIGERDHLLDSGIRRRVTRIRAIAATLLPDDPPVFVCWWDGCRIVSASLELIQEHAYYVHGGPRPAHWENT